MKRLLVLLFAATGLLVAASPASAASAWKGVVVAKDAKRGTVVTASAAGLVRTARSANAHAFKIGQRLDVRGTALGDGTFKAAAVRANGRAKTAKVRAVVVRWQKAQKRLLVSAGGSTFALSRKATRTLTSSSEHTPRPGDQITATVMLTAATPLATSVSTVGRLGVLEVEGILTKIEAGSIELVIARTGFVTLALPAGFALPAGLAQFDAVEAHVSVGSDGKLTLLSIRADDENDRDDDDDDVDEDEDELEVTGKITALSDTSITVTPGSSSPVTCALSKPLTGFAVGDLVEIECSAGTAGALRLEEIKHEDNDENDDDDDDDHSGHGKGGGDDH